MEDIDLSTEDTLFFRQKEANKTEDLDDNATTEEGDRSSAEKRSSTAKNESAATVDNDAVVPLAAFRTWKKLPKRLNVWVFQFDANNPTDLSLSEGGGFPRPDLLPMADIFRSSGD